MEGGCAVRVVIADDAVVTRGDTTALEGSFIIVVYGLTPAERCRRWGTPRPTPTPSVASSGAHRRSPPGRLPPLGNAPSHANPLRRLVRRPLPLTPRPVAMVPGAGPVAIVIGTDGIIVSVDPLDDGLAEAMLLQSLRDAGVGAEAVVRTPMALPGFVDIHTHGWGGADDFVDFWLNPDFTQAMLPSMATTGFLASIVFTDDGGAKARETYRHLATVVGRVIPGRAVCEGIHAEGPCVEDCGGLPCTRHQSMPPKAFEDLVKEMMPCGLKVMTISPAVDARDGYARLRVLLAEGVMPSLGHDRKCSVGDILGAMRVAAAHGVQCHVTHLFNVCGFHHRNPSLVNFGLTSRFPKQPEYEGLASPTVEVITDLKHVHPLTIAAVLSSRDIRDLVTITDSVLAPKRGARLSYNGRTMVVAQDCKAVYLEGTETLAGSCCSMLAAFNNLIRVVGATVAEASQMLATNPARIAGLGHAGAIAVGKRADIVCFSTGGLPRGNHSKLWLETTIIAGKVAYRL